MRSQLDTVTPMCSCYVLISLKIFFPGILLKQGQFNCYSDIADVKSKMFQQLKRLGSAVISQVSFFELQKEKRFIEFIEK